MTQDQLKIILRALESCGEGDSDDTDCGQYFDQDYVYEALKIVQKALYEKN